MSLLQTLIPRRSKRPSLSKYRSQETLGYGAFSKVKKMQHKKTGDIVAVKIVEKRKLNSILLSKAYREKEILQACQHSNIVKCYDSFEDDDYFGLILEYIGGQELFEKISSQRNFTEVEARRMAKEMLAPIEYLHQNNIIHRDIKPENFLISSSDGRIKLIDFNLGNFVSGNNQRGIQGTPEFMAPEIIRGEFYGKPVDMWAFGTIVYLMLSGGYFPFHQSENRDEVYYSIVHDSVKFPQKHWDHISSEGIHFLRGCLNKDPNTRLTVEQALAHPWFRIDEKELQARPQFVFHQRHVKKAKVRKSFQKAVKLIAAMNHWRTYKKEDFESNVVGNEQLQRTTSPFPHQLRYLQNQIICKYNCLGFGVLFVLLVFAIVCQIRN